MRHRCAGRTPVPHARLHLIQLPKYKYGTERKGCGTPSPFWRTTFCFGCTYAGDLLLSSQWAVPSTTAALLRAEPLGSGVQFQSMLWRLLGHALDLSNPESDTLVEDALRLLVSVLNCTTALTPALQVADGQHCLPANIPEHCCCGLRMHCCPRLDSHEMHGHSVHG